MMSPAGFGHGVITQRIAATVTVRASGGALTLANEADSFVSTAVPGLTVRLVDLFPPTS